MTITNISLHYFAEKLFQPFLDQKEITEIAINRPGEVWYEQHGIWQKNDNANITNKLLKSFAISLASFNETAIDDCQPILSGTLETGERIQVVLPSAVEKNTISVTLRKPSKNILSHESYIENDFYSKIVAAKVVDQEKQELISLYSQKQISLFMERAVEFGKTIVFAGATGSGKTSYMKTLIEYIPLNCRLITIEDTSEVKFYKHKNYVHLFFPSEAANDPQAVITSASLLKACFRMKPDRILLSEIRGGETWDFVKVVNSGHGGSMTSIHAGSISEALEGIITRCYQNLECQNLSYSVIKNIVLSSIDIVCHINCSGGKRYLSEIYYKDTELAKLKAEL
ncbi:P-type DNA transfer ATPase VirB11 [Rickettsia endosymbiont of Polydrusus tereticollis]|uniref:P-type DNA transfer ATPase VirB11 n=1 Tax=Rickettsia endosymbiont of Polydrusus tereticollis TaxID=3066251 RepID=UPI0031334674